MPRSNPENDPIDEEFVKKLQEVVRLEADWLDSKDEGDE